MGGASKKVGSREPMLRGTLFTMRRKCGKPTCRCVNGETHESPALAFPVAFLLSDAPFRYGDSAIGLLGLAGAAGALCASVAGRLADRGLARIERIGAAASIAGSFGILWLGRSSIVLVIVGVLVLDVGVQGVQVLNQSTVYELVPWARSRINGVYMTTYFIGGALGSAGGAFAYDHRGWRAVCILGAALGLAAVTQAARPEQVESGRPESGNRAET